MSSLAKVTTAYALQNDVKVVPATGWKILPYTSNSLNNSNEMTESAIITDSRLKKAGLVTSGEVSGDIESELMFGAFDDLIAAAFFSEWEGSSPSTLKIGDTKKSFAFTKDFTDINVNHVFTGCIVNKFSLDVTTDDLVKVTFGIMGLGYDQSKTESFAKSPAKATDGKKASGLSVGTIKADNAEIGVCVESFSLEIDNQAEIQKCLGENIYGGNVLAMLANISGSMTLAYSQKAHDLLELQRTGATISLEFPLIFSATDKYVIKLPKVQISGEIPQASGSGLATADVSFTVVEDSPIIEKYTA